MEIMSMQNIPTRRIDNRIFLDGFKKSSWILICIFSFLQIIFYWSLENLFAVISVVVAWSLVSVSLLKLYKIRKYTLSFVIIIGFALTQFLLPLVFIILEGKPLVYNMELPEEVFVHSLLSLIVLLITHNFYILARKKSLAGIFRSTQNKLAKIGLFRPPSDLQVWIIAFIGIFAMVLKYFEKGDEGTSALSKFIEAFLVFSYAPFFLLIKSLYSSDNRAASKKTATYVAIYTLLLILIGIGGNSRGAFMRGITAFGIAYFVGLLLGKLDYKIINVRNVILVGFGLWFISGPLVNLGTSMVMVRGQRTSVNSEELISITLKTYQNEELMEEYRKLKKLIFREWDEDYFDNIFLSRFCNLKFNDLSLVQAEKIEDGERMRDISLNKFLATFPQPIINVLQFNIDKGKIGSASFGDYLYFYAGGSRLGGFRTGHFAGTGMAAFGWWYLLLLGIGMFPIYFLSDLFVLRKFSNDLTGSSLHIISMLGLVSMSSFFMFLSLSGTSESVINIYVYLLRGWIQLVFLYWIVLNISRFTSRFFQ